MTIIAWDGKTLAADKADTNAGFANTVTKIYRVPGGLLGLSGDGDHALDCFCGNGIDTLTLEEPDRFPKGDI